MLPHSDTIDTASRMEGTSQPGSIHVSAATHLLLENEEHQWKPTGGVQVSGKVRDDGIICPKKSRPTANPKVWV